MEKGVRTVIPKRVYVLGPQPFKDGDYYKMGF